MALFYNAIFSAISKTHVVFSSVIYIVKKLLIKLLKQVESCTQRGNAAVIYSILSVECFFFWLMRGMVKVEIYFIVCCVETY